MWLAYARAIFATVILALAALGLGSPIARILPEKLSAWSKAICCWIAGFGILGVALLVVGQWSFSRITIGVVLALGIGAAAVTLIRGEWAALKFPLRITRAQIIPAAIIAAVLLITAAGGLSEPAGDWGYDGVAYHLLGPKVWLRNGIIRPVADNTNTAYPAVAETCFAALMAIGGDRAPGFSAVFTFALLLLIAGSLARRCGLDGTGGYWVAALVAAMPAVYDGAHSGFIDAIYAAFILAAARIAFDADTRSHFFAVGLFCGLAMAAKYTGLVAGPLLLFVAVWPRESVGAIARGEILRRVGLAAIVALVVASPFYLRNWLVLGSPIYPPPASFTKFLHIKYLSADALRSFYGYSLRRGQGHGRNCLALLLLPFNLTYHTADFNGGAGIGLTALALAPLGAIAAWRDPFARRLAILSGVLALTWFATIQESRYLIHVYAIGAIFAVLGWRYIKSVAGRRGAVLAAIVICISVPYGLRSIALARRMDTFSVFSERYAAERRDALMPFWKSFEFINHDPSVTKLLILDPSVPPYYSEKHYLKPFGQWGEVVLPEARTPADVLAELSQLGVSHVLDVRSSVSGFRVPQNFPGVALVFEQPGERVYRVTLSK